MSHPLMFDEQDPYLARVREICLAFPGADEKISHGRPNFFTRKVFATFGGSLKGDHYSPIARNALLFLPDASEREALLERESFFVPAYFGPSGWLGLSFHLVGAVERSKARIAGRSKFDIANSIFEKRRPERSPHPVIMTKV